MIKKLIWIFSFLILIFICGIGLAQGEIVVTAPGGGFVDVEKNVMNYKGSDTKLVEVRWDNLFLEASYLEYNNRQEMLEGKGKVRVIQNAPVKRVLTAAEIKADIRQNNFIANQDVTLSDEKNIITGNKIEWEQKNDFVQISGQATVKYRDWLLKSNFIEGHLVKGSFIATGQVEAFNKNNLIHCGRLIFNRQHNKIFAQDNPVLIRGRNEMAASEIIYNLDTNQIIANGTVKTRIINEAETK